KLSKLEPDTYRGHFAKGMLLFGKGMANDVAERLKYMPPAVEEFAKSVELNGKFWQGYLYRANSYFHVANAKTFVKEDNKETVEKAVADYKKVLELNDKFDRAAFFMGITYSLVKDYDNAIAAITKAIEMNASAKYYSYRGEITRLKAESDLAAGKTESLVKTVDSAIADYTKVLELEPKTYYMYIQRAVVKEMKNDLKGAKEDLEKFLELSPNHSNAKQVKEDLKALEKALKEQEEKN
ncbi:MAG: hypothetical protein ABIH42_03970, partial [Planctomycetota bacterium]